MTFTKMKAEIVKGQCPTCHEHTVLVGITNDYYSCIVYGYSYSHKILTELDPEWVNSMEVYTKFSCKVDKII